jgi:hypothetical protein
VRADTPRPPDLGRPEAAFEGRPAGGYTEVWSGPVLVTSFPGTIGFDVIEKRGVAGTTVEATVVDGARAYWISAPHAFVYLDEHGVAQEDTVRLSDNALVWTRDGVTYRLESPYDRARALELAESMFD